MIEYWFRCPNCEHPCESLREERHSAITITDVTLFDRGDGLELYIDEEDLKLSYDEHTNIKYSCYDCGYVFPAHNPEALLDYLKRNVTLYETEEEDE